MSSIDKHWLEQDVVYNFNSDLTGTGGGSICIIDVKKKFFYVFYFGHVFYVFLTFFYFPNVFLFLQKRRQSSERQTD